MSEKIIELRNVQKYYKMGKESLHALKDINVEIEKGDFFIIMGKSGSGKTTLLNILGFLDKFDEGEFFFYGEDVTKHKENKRSELRNLNIGFVFQQFNLIDGLTIYQNVEIPMTYNKKFNKKQREKIITEKLERVGLKDKIKRRPTELSGGQQQRVAIARALVNNPDIIFADEPTGALDTDTGLEIMKLLLELNKEGKTIIMVTHDPDFERFATKLIRIKNGVIESEEFKKEDMLDDGNTEECTC
ncbi:MAG: ABC transporter ATP-binding protein [Sarcina sp.]